MRRQTAEAILCLGLSAVATALALATPLLIDGSNPNEPYYAKSAFFPIVALSLMAAFGALAAAQALRGAHREQSDEVESGRSSIAGALIGALFLALSVPLAILVGYFGATFLTSLAFGHLVRLRLKTNVAIAIILATLLHLVFVAGFKVWFAPSLLVRILQ